MALNVSALSSYVNEHSADFITKTIYTGKTKDLVQILPDIKGTQKVPVLSTSVVLQAAGCSFNPQNTTAISQVSIATVDHKIEDKICVDTLQSYFTQTMMKQGSAQQPLPFEAVFLKELTDKISKSIENLIWMGNASGSDLVNGFYYVIGTASGANSAGSLTLTSAANVVDAAYTMVNALPADIQGAEDLVLFMNPANYNKLVQGLMAAYPAIASYQSAQPDEILLPGTSVKVIKTYGLGTSNRMFAGQASNFIIGTDAISDFARIETWDYQRDKTFEYRIQFRIGMQVLFQDQIVYSTNA